MNVENIEAITGIRFPIIRARTLSKKQVVFPDNTEGFITLILIAFRRQAQAMIDSWLEPYEKEFREIQDFTFYEIPMIGGMWARMFSSAIDGGMRSGIPSQKHGNVATYYGSIEKYRQILAMDDINLGYVFLLDKNGIIRWTGRGFADSEQTREMITIAKKL